MGNVVDFNQFKAKKGLTSDLVRDREALSQSYKAASGEQDFIEQVAILYNELEKLALLVEMLKFIEEVKPVNKNIDTEQSLNSSEPSKLDS